MLNATFRPLRAWPGPATPAHERGSRFSFKASWSNTLDLLERELRQINARDVIIEIDVDDRHIRNDGWPKQDARPRSPGVILSFHHPTAGALRYPCDGFVDWQHNLRAIALGLEALRKVDRYGITRRGEQYTGWKALPASTLPAMSTEQAARRVAATSFGPEAADSESVRKRVLSDRAYAREIIRVALARTHPDAGGSDEAFTLIGEAKRVLTAHHGGTL